MVPPLRPDESRGWKWHHGAQQALQPEEGAVGVCRQGQHQKKTGGREGDRNPRLSFFLPNSCQWLVLAEATRKPGQGSVCVRTEHRGQLRGCGASQRRVEKVWVSRRGHVDRSQHRCLYHRLATQLPTAVIIGWMGEARSFVLCGKNSMQYLPFTTKIISSKLQGLLPAQTSFKFFSRNHPKLILLKKCANVKIY